MHRGARNNSFLPLRLPAHRPRPLLAWCGQARPFRRDDEVEIEAERGRVDEAERRTHEHDGEEGLDTAMEGDEGRRRAVGGTRVRRQGELRCGWGG